MLSEVKIVNVMWCLARVHMLFNVSDVVNVNCEMVTGKTDVNQFMNEGVCATVSVNWIQSWVWIGEWWWMMEWCDRVMMLQIKSSGVCYTINKLNKLQPTQSTIKARALPVVYREYKHTKTLPNWPQGLCRNDLCLSTKRINYILQNHTYTIHIHQP